MTTAPLGPLEEIDEALAHAAASRLIAAASGALSALAAVSSYLDGLLDLRLACAAGKNPAVPGALPDTSQGLSPRQGGGVSGPGAAAAGGAAEAGAVAVVPGA
ncbi:hypothetical protein ACOACO_17525 [Nocardioides sp. CPCC 205120]|uniref:hypothetical protein n=1 Tax=Nocardioides sp. CPCC 205120 TaxID=3406462 RepID=UPI003B50CB24